MNIDRRTLLTGLSATLFLPRLARAMSRPSDAATALY
jgi:hypothetical protein